MHTQSLRLLLVAFTALFAFVFAVPVEELNERDYARTVVKYKTKTETKWAYKTKYSKTKTLTKWSTKTQTTCTTKYSTKTVTVAPYYQTSAASQVSTKTVTVSGYVPGYTGTITVTSTVQNTATETSYVPGYTGTITVTSTVQNTATETSYVPGYTGTITVTSIVQNTATETSYVPASTETSYVYDTTVETSYLSGEVSVSTVYVDNTAVCYTTTSESETTTEAPTTTTTTTETTTEAPTTTKTTTTTTIYPGNPTATPLGCYAEPRYSRILPAKKYVANDMTTQKCLGLCFGAGYLFAGVEYGKECWCDNVLGANGGELADDANCKTRLCFGADDEWCGGDGHIYIYKNILSTATTTTTTTTTTSAPATTTSAGSQATGPATHPGADGYEYLGCRSEPSGGRALGSSVGTDDMTPQKCFDICSSSNTYDSVSNSYGPFQYCALEYSRECWYGNQLAADQTTDEANCMFICSGDDDFYCGGYGTFGLYSLPNVPKI
jgi:hypothetical protein